MRIARPAIAAATLALALVAGLLGLTRSTPAQMAVDPAVQRGQQVYTQYCATCHGATGKGDGQSGQALPIKPQDLTVGQVLNPLPDHFLHAVIAQGGQAVGLSPLMPGFAPQISATQIADVIAYTRTLAQPAFDPKAVLPVPVKREGPVQPIFFSHVVHAGSYRMDCQYCHAGARRSSAAGLPSVERCMGCHKVVANQGNPEIDKLKGYWERQEPIPWVRIYKVPEHARFPHKNHVQAGLQCQSCHGPIEAMERVNARTGQEIINDLMNLAGLTLPGPKLSMGWCVECHRTANAQGVGAVQQMADVHRPSVKAPAGGPTQKRAAPLECVNCHH